MNNLIAMLALALFATGCTGDGAGKYVGVWQTSEERPKTYEIRKDGETYLLDDLKGRDFGGKKTSPRPLSKQGDQLVLNTGMGAAALALSDDKNTLYFDKWVLKRVPAKDADKVRDDIVSAHNQQVANRAACETLGKEFQARRKEVSSSQASAAEKMSSSAELRNQLVQKAEAIPDCKRKLLLF